MDMIKSGWTKLKVDELLLLPRPAQFSTTYAKENGFHVVSITKFADNGYYHLSINLNFRKIDSKTISTAFITVPFTTANYEVVKTALINQDPSLLYNLAH